MKAIKVLSREENLDMEKLEKVIGDYLFTEKLPLRDEIIGTMKSRPSLKERGSTAERVSTKILKRFGLKPGRSILRSVPRINPRVSGRAYHFCTAN